MRRRERSRRKVGAVHAGDVLKFQVELRAHGASHYTLGDNFAPEAQRPRRRRVPPAVQSRSTPDLVRLDGAIVAYVEFRRRRTATGLTPVHAYAPGAPTQRHSPTPRPWGRRHQAAGRGVRRSSRSKARPNGDVGPNGERRWQRVVRPRAPAPTVRSSPSLGGRPRRVRAPRIRADRQAGAAVPVNAAACASGFPSVSGDGRFVAYECAGTSSPTSAPLTTVVVVISRPASTACRHLG
jgi:hypothetical protein